MLFRSIALNFKVNSQKAGKIDPSGSTFYGYMAGNNNQSNNTAFGFEALYNNTTGLSNIANGWKSLYSNTTGTQNTAYGDGSLYSNLTGVNNTSIGSYALNSNTIGSKNIAIGASALHDNTTASQNIAIGISALPLQSFNNSGSTWNSNNVAIGYQSLYSNQPTSSNNGYQNTAVGTTALYSNTIGASNTGIGGSSLYSNITGGGNTAVGGGSLSGNTTGSYNTALGINDFSSGTYDNSTAIGANAIITASNQVVLGDNGVTTFYCYGAKATGFPAYGTLSVSASGQIGLASSSKRYKKDIVPLEINTSLLYNLRPVSYTFISDNSRSFGLIAEEVNKVIPQLVFYRKAKDVIPKNNSDELIPEGVHYEYLPTLLLAELQKQHANMEEQRKLIDELLQKVTSLQTQLDKLSK